MLCESAHRACCVEAIRKMIERKKKTVEGRLVRHAVTDVYADFGSQAYAPLTRIGVFLDRNSEQYVVKNKYLANYAGRYFQVNNYKDVWIWIFSLLQTFIKISSNTFLLLYKF